MPELPEVETLARDLRETVVGRTITEAWVSPDAPRLVQAMTVDAFTTGLRGRAIDGVSRRGKYLMVAVSGGLFWVLHRRMSGNVLHRQQGDPDEAFLRARFRLDDGSELRFVDLRKFGTMWLTDDAESIVAHLGPEPLDASFTDDVLRAVLKKRSAPVKAVLLDQGAIAGIGNLYADEALHYARVHPMRRASSLRKAEVSALRKGIVDALKQGLRNLGSSVGHVIDGEEVSLRDHVNLNGKAGGNQEYLVAYGREGRPCRTCGTAIERTKIGQRSAHYCPVCQKKPRRKKQPCRGGSRAARPSP